MTAPDYDDDTYDEQDNEQDDSPQVTLSRKRIKAMERDAREARQLREEIAEMKRGQALSGLGVDLTERQRKALLATVDGDLTAESVRTAAEELGFVKPAPTSEAAAEAAALDRMSEASNSSTADPADMDPVARLNRIAEESGFDSAAILAEAQRQGVFVNPSS